MSIDDVKEFALKHGLVHSKMNLVTIKRRLIDAIEMLEEEAFELKDLEDQVPEAAKEIKS